MKEGWNWKPEELARLRRYIEQREASRSVGWGSGKSEVQEIADDLGRGYFPVFRRIERLRKEMGAKGPMRRPRRGMMTWPKTGAIYLSPQAYETVQAIAEAEHGGNVSACVRSLIEIGLKLR